MCSAFDSAGFFDHSTTEADDRKGEVVSVSIVDERCEAACGFCWFSRSEARELGVRRTALLIVRVAQPIPALVYYYVATS